MSVGKIVGFVVAAVVSYAVGYFIVSRVPPLASLLAPKA